MCGGKGLSPDFWKFWAGQTISNLGSSIGYYRYSVVSGTTPGGPAFRDDAGESAPI